MKTKSLLIFTILLFLQPIANYAVTIKDEDPEEIILDKEDKSTTSRPRDIILCAAYFHSSDDYIEFHHAGLDNINIYILNSNGTVVKEEFVNSETYSVTYINVPKIHDKYTIIINNPFTIL